MDRRRFETFVEEQIANWADRAAQLRYQASSAQTADDNRYFRKIGLVAERCSTVAALLKSLSDAPITEWHDCRERICKAMKEAESGFQALEAALADDVNALEPLPPNAAGEKRFR